MDERGPQTADRMLPALPLEAWKDTKQTLHLYAQIVGKVRMTLHPKQNHWWHVPLYVSARGLTTGPMPAGVRLVEIEFDLIDHKLVMRASTGEVRAFGLHDGLSVAEFYRAVRSRLREMGVEVEIVARPYDPERVGSNVPFEEDDLHASYRPEEVERWWRALGWMHSVLTEFKGRFVGKSTPVHLFWHSFDLAYTRFSGNEAPMEGGSAVDREAYSHEVISFGFWPGDDNVPAPSFYSYTYPEPAGLGEAPLEPDAAYWADNGGSSMALLSYETVRQMADPKEALLRFFESAYAAGAERAGWDVDTLARTT